VEDERGLGVPRNERSVLMTRFVHTEIDHDRNSSRSSLQEKQLLHGTAGGWFQCENASS